MLSIKPISESASAERLAEQVREDHAKFFEQQEEFAINLMRQNGLTLVRGDTAEVASIYIKTIDMDGGCFRLQLRSGDELRDSSGLCIGCNLPLTSSTKANCYLGCRNTAVRLYPDQYQSVSLLEVAKDKSWALTNTPKGMFLSLLDPESPPEKLKNPSPKVIGILKR
jgi:hypothetical protein